uniref:Uncharacterized protein n=1 Tax=Oryza punctata TaxID=4537 RepID=A0A0E0LHJ4_ORYPU
MWKSPASDFDDDDLPANEPEFILRAVDDSYRPPQPLPPLAPPHLQRIVARAPPPPPPRPLAVALAQPLLDQPNPCLRDLCNCCYFIKIAHCVLIIILAGVMEALALALPDELKEGLVGAYSVIFPFIIAFSAYFWLVLLE